LKREEESKINVIDVGGRQLEIDRKKVVLGRVVCKNHKIVEENTLLLLAWG